MRRARTKKILAFAFVTVVFAVACSSSELITPQPCRGETCTCEQDPQQLRCRGFSPDGGGSFEDAGTLDVNIDASPADAGGDVEPITDAADEG